MNDLFIKILIEAGSTEKEAKKHIAAGTMIYTEAEKPEFIANYIGGCGDEAEALEIWERLESVKLDGVVYKIDVAL